MSRSRSTARHPLLLAAAAVALAACLPACRSRSGDPALLSVARLLQKGDRLVLVRALDPAATRVATVVSTAAGKPELRIYESGGGG
jgi:hypothetical protein